MTGSEFVALYGNKGMAAWEAAALDMARRGEIVKWPLRPVTFTDGTHTLEIEVASDYFAVGTPEDFLRLPLTPGKAQEVADLWGMLLPTPAMVKAIHEQSDVKVKPEGLPNKGANLAQYADHNARVEAALAAEGAPFDALKDGMKKDIVMGKIVSPNKLAIYGWFLPDGVPPGPDPYPMSGSFDANGNPKNPSWRIQMYSPAHGASYVDYSHGVRLVSPTAYLDGREVSLASVLKDPQLAKLVSWEGPLSNLRYATSSQPNPSSGTYQPNVSLAARGLATIQYHQAVRQKASA